MLSITLTRGAEVHALLSSVAFLKQWRTLFESCSWATPFQGPDFVAAWYDLYQQRCEPVLVQGYSSDGELVGLLPLACAVGSRQLVVAGTPQSEYQVWLALPSWSEAFLTGTLEELRCTTFGGSLTFAYLPPQAPLEWLRKNRSLAARCHIEALPRPVMRLGEASQEMFQQFWRNKTVRNQLNRLKRLGLVRLERVIGPARLEPILDEIIAHYDCRIGALLGYPPFWNDPLKKRFLLRLLAIPELLHVTTLRAGDTIVGANLGFCHKNSVCLGVFSYSPFQGKCSPGKLLLMMLAEQLQREGFTELDLTPDGDWKEQLATCPDSVHKLTIYFRSSANLKRKILERVKGRAKRLLARIGVNPQRLFAIYHRARSMQICQLPKVLRRQATRLFRSPGLKVYSLKPTGLARCSNESHTGVDRLDHLLVSVGGSDRQQTREVLSLALKRLEAGCRVHTCVRDGKLMWSCWSVTGNGQTVIPEVQLTLGGQARWAVLFGFHTASGTDTEAVNRVCLLEVLSDLADTSELDTFYLLIDGHDRQMGRVVESIGALLEPTHQHAPGSIQQVGALDVIRPSTMN